MHQSSLNHRRLRLCQYITFNINSFTDCMHQVSRSLTRPRTSCSFHQIFLLLLLILKQQTAKKFHEVNNHERTLNLCNSPGVECYQNKKMFDPLRFSSPFMCPKQQMFNHFSLKIISSKILDSKIKIRGMLEDSFMLYSTL